MSRGLRRWFITKGLLGRVDGFDQDQAAYEGEEGSEVFGGLLAAQGDAFEALDFADGLFDARASFVENAGKERGLVLRI